jgi:tetratricopeptide (TPR) repeat protein
MRIDPKGNYAYQNLSDAYMSLGRFDEAKAVVDQAIAQKISPRTTRFMRFQLAYLHGDEAAEKRIVEEGLGGLDEPLILFQKARGDLARGRIQDARAAFDRAVRFCKEHQNVEFAAEVRSIQASFEAELGFVNEPRQQLSEALSLALNKDTKALAAVPLARLGDIARAQKFHDELAAEFPTNTLLTKVQLAVSQAAIELQRNQPQKAIAALESSLPYDLGSGPNGPNYSSIYLRGAAYLKVEDGAKALAEYQKILDHRGIDVLSAFYPLAHLGSARAYALQKDTAHARTAYQDFFAAWKDAEPDIPILKQARAEYAALR